MCDICELSICLFFDMLVMEYYRDNPPVSADEEVRRPRYMPMDVRNAPQAAQSANAFSDMVEAAEGIGYAAGEFLNELGRQTGLPEQVVNWARGRVPNGLARKIILTRAEMMIRERGARPELSFLEAA